MYEHPFLVIILDVSLLTITNIMVHVCNKQNMLNITILISAILPRLQINHFKIKFGVFSKAVEYRPGIQAPVLKLKRLLDSSIS